MMEYTIRPLVTARFAIDAGRLTYLRNYGKQIWIPCPFFFIEGGKKRILVDTSGEAEHMAGMRSEPVEHVCGFEDALGSVGVSPEEIDIVIHTHLMYDHCANSKKCPRAVFIAQKKELEFARDVHPLLAGTYQKQLYEGLRFEEVDGDQEIEDGIRVLFTPGHTPGCQSVAVKTWQGLAVITGFCCIRENFDSEKLKEGPWQTDKRPEVIPPGIHYNLFEAYDSALRVGDMADILIPFHDPEMCSRKSIP